MKRYFALITVIILTSALALTAAGCNKPNGDISSSTNSSAASQENANSSSEQAIESEVEIPFEILDSMKNSGEVSMYAINGVTDDDLVNYFKDNCDGILQHVNIVTDRYAMALLGDYAAGKSPDIIITTKDSFSKVITKGMVYNKSELKAMGFKHLNHPAIKKGEIRAANTSSYRGEVYALDAEINPTLIVCNETALAKCGISATPKQLYDEGNWNFDKFTEILAAVRDLKNDLDSDGKPDYLAYSGQENSWIMTALDGDIIKENTDGTLFADVENEEVIAAAAKFQELSNSNYITTSDTGFRQGRITLLATDAQSLASSLYSGKLPFEWSIVPFPVGSSNERGTVSGSFYGYCVSRTSDNVQGAINLIIAKAIYNETERRINTEYDLENWVNSEGIKVLEEARLKTRSVYWDSVGNTCLDQWNYWQALQTEGADPAYVLQVYKRSFESNIELDK